MYLTSYNILVQGNSLIAKSPGFCSRYKISVWFCGAQLYFWYINEMWPWWKLYQMVENISNNSQSCVMNHGILRPKDISGWSRKLNREILYTYIYCIDFTSWNSVSIWGDRGIKRFQVWIIEIKLTARVATDLDNMENLEKSGNLWKTLKISGKFEFL